MSELNNEINKHSKDNRLNSTRDHLTSSLINDDSKIQGEAKLENQQKQSSKLVENGLLPDAHVTDLDKEEKKGNVLKYAGAGAAGVAIVGDVAEVAAGVALSEIVIPCAVAGFLGYGAYKVIQHMRHESSGNNNESGAHGASAKSPGDAARGRVPGDHTAGGKDGGRVNETGASANSLGDAAHGRVPGGHTPGGKDGGRVNETGASANSLGDATHGRK